MPLLLYTLFHDMLLLPEEPMGEVWELCNKPRFIEKHFTSFVKVPLTLLII
jgi:hypothetical protein